MQTLKNRPVEKIKDDQLLLFDLPTPPATLDEFSSPSGYKGLAAFHKYWGKKPVECIAFLTELLTEENEIVLDPFMGSGLIARETLIRKRKFLGIDINPIAVELAKLNIDLPDPESLKAAFLEIEKSVSPLVNESYRLNDNKIGSHYLWNGKDLQSVWLIEPGQRSRSERYPTQHDVELSEHYAAYEPQHLRPLHIFHNSRINAKDAFGWRDLFTGRALHNIDLILSAIHQTSPANLRRALGLCLTSALGQMSKMVFAISKRGKTKGSSENRIEVGSWVIGYWRPTLHFEINVWRCFEKRVKDLLKAISGLKGELQFSQTPLENLSELSKPTATLFSGDCVSTMDGLEENSISLILADPPHSDRIPYLELSEMWNAVSGFFPLYEKEIIVSNAPQRKKTKGVYLHEMRTFLRSAARVLKPGRFLALMFNARDSESWEFLSTCLNDTLLLEFKGSFPMTYSANSVVQKHRKGSMKSDYILLYQKPGASDKNFDLSICQCIEGWSEQLPDKALLKNKAIVD